MRPAIERAIEYNPDLFARESVERLAARLSARLAALAEALAGVADDADAWALPLLPAAEAALVLRGFNETAAPFPADPIAAYAERGVPIANQRGAVRGMHRRFSWDALNVTNATTCGGDKCYFQGEREGEGWLVGGRSYLIQQSRGWAFAEELRVDFGVGHLMRGA